MRIVSVLPSATEIVCALGARAELVGRSAECDFPADVREVPVVMRPRTLDADQPSAAIDARVREARGRDESLYTLHVETLRRARPDVLLTQDLCGVCSVTSDEVAAACREAQVDPSIVSLTPRTLDEVWASLETVGKAIGRLDEARRLAADARRRSTKTALARSRRVAVVEWLDPPILAGLWTPAIVEAAGATAVGPPPGKPGERTSWEELRQLGPDIVVLSPCSFSVDRTVAELTAPALRDRVRGAVPGDATFVADEAYFSRPGPRLVHGLDLVRALARGTPLPPAMPVLRWSSDGIEAVA